jgi:hypothetical protein
VNCDSHAIFIFVVYSLAVPVAAVTIKEEQVFPHIHEFCISRHAAMRGPCLYPSVHALDGQRRLVAKAVVRVHPRYCA